MSVYVFVIVTLHPLMVTEHILPYHISQTVLSSNKHSYIKIHPQTHGPTSGYQ